MSTLQIITELPTSDELRPPFETLIPWDDGRMWVAESYAETLRRAGLASLADVMQTTRGHRLRALTDRENWRLDLDGPRHEPRGVYLKKHHVRSWRNWLRTLLGGGSIASAGRVEARNIARLARDGIAAMRLVAFGERTLPNGRSESFVLTEELAGYSPLDDFLRERFPPAGQIARDVDFLRLLDCMADVARRFHHHGYNHRDFYCCHFFIRETAIGQYQVNLIDLQRVEQRRRFRRRWLVKDLAQLAYSAPRDRVRFVDRLRFFKRYLGVRKLRPADKQFIRAILKKQAQMERSLGRSQA